MRGKGDTFPLFIFGINRKKVQSSRFKVQGSKFEVQGSKFDVCSLSDDRIPNYVCRIVVGEKIGRFRTTG
jgi:hypothetical protein